MASTTEEIASYLYVHVPFCARKCSYCAFYSESSDGELVNRYVAALIKEMEIVAASAKPRTIFFGGGTPSLLTIRQWESVFQAMQRLGLTGAEEWTIESNPATVSVDKARLWRSVGVNRVSMGVQSLDESLLERLGRIHSRGMVFKSFENLRTAGFENLNIDLMFGIPGQTMDTWRNTLREALALRSEHLSCYEVIYEEDTPLYDEYKNGGVEVGEDLICDMYEHLLEETARHGLDQYEVANFARRAKKIDAVETDIGWSREGLAGTWVEPGYACRHNINYWRGGAYHGLGPSAAGFIRGRRTRNISNTKMYCEQLENGRRAIEWSEALTPMRRAGEIAAFGLRMNSGWSFDEFAVVTGYDLREHWEKDLEELVRLGWARQTRDRFHLTQRGMRFADAAAQYLLR